MCRRFWLAVFVTSAALMAADAKAGSPLIISVVANSDYAGNACQTDGIVTLCGRYAYYPYVVESYEPLGVYRPPQQPRMYVIAPNAKIISLQQAR